LFPPPLIIWSVMENLLDTDNRKSLEFLLTYPLFDEKTFDSRMRELSSMDINSVFSFGNVQLKIANIIGKGSVGLVTLVKYKNKLLALKIRRTDANRLNMYDEVLYQSLANSIGIGPFLVNFSENFILMEYIKGSNIESWYKSQTSNKKLLRCTNAILQQSFLLDCIKLDHGQLSRLDRHIVVSLDGLPTILDFETSSTKRRSSNVTSVSQSIFLHGPIHAKLGDAINKERTEIIKSIKEYKKHKNREKFQRILNLLES
jgi:putative serine/threonine protein kinase